MRRTTSRGPRERAPPLVRVRVLDSLSLSLSHDTCDSGAQPVVDVRACPGVLLDDNDHAISRRKWRCIEEEETGEGLTKCAGPPTAVLSTSSD